MVATEPSVSIPRFPGLFGWVNCLAPREREVESVASASIWENNFNRVVRYVSASPRPVGTIRAHVAGHAKT